MAHSTQNKTEKKERIYVPYGNVKKISEALECTPQMVNGALRGLRTSKLAEKIRHVALKEYEGQIIKSA